MIWFYKNFRKLNKSNKIIYVIYTKIIYPNLREIEGKHRMTVNKNDIMLRMNPK